MGCDHPGCTEQASGRCASCHGIFCLRHYTIGRGAIICDQCARRTQQAEQQRKSRKNNRWLQCIIFGMLLGIFFAYQAVVSTNESPFSDNGLIFLFLGGFFGVAGGGIIGSFLFGGP